MDSAARLLSDLVAIPSVNPMGRPLSGDGFLEAGMTAYLKRWFEAIAARPATVRAYGLVESINPNQSTIRTEEERKILFGQTASVVTAKAE